MAKSRAHQTQAASSFAVAAIMCMILQILTAILSSAGTVALPLPHGDFAAEVSVGGVYCDAKISGRSETPAHHHDHQDCALCYGGAHASSLDRAVLPPAQEVLGSSYQASAQARPFSDDPKALLVGWASTWSSRAPPAVS